MRVMMLFCVVLAAALVPGGLAASAQAAEPQTSHAQAVKAAAPKAKPKMKVRVTPRSAWRGYGFLPGYTQPPNIHDPYARRRGDPNAGTYPWYGWPGYYRGRWNGGGFGPCYTKTPIGPVWNCG